MSIVIKNHTLLIILVFFCLRMDHFGQSVAIVTPLESKSLQQTEGKNVASTGEDIILALPIQRWTVVPSYSWSFFNKGRDSWQSESIDLFYQQDKYLLLGASVDSMHRPPYGNDIMYSFNASWYPLKNLEVHGEISHTPDANFLPNEIYSAGLQYMLNNQLGLLFDLEQLNFYSNSTGWNDDILQIKPGVSFWFTEKSYITFRYTHGWVQGVTDYDCYNATVNLGDMPHNAVLSLGFGYGTDPDLDFGSGVTTLSDAYSLSIFYKQPINPDLSIFVGLEYVYRLQPNGDDELYQKLTPTIGLSWKF